MMLPDVSKIKGWLYKPEITFLYESAKNRHHHIVEMF